MKPLKNEVTEVTEWFNAPRFEHILRLYSPQQVVNQRGTIPCEYAVARSAADGFYIRLRELFDQRKSITTFGPYSPGQAVAMKRAGIEGIYLGGWATSAKGSTEEDPGPDLASYPLGQVPDEAAPIVRALLTADRNQRFTRNKMSAEQRATTREVDFRPFIIADADTGHGGDAHVRNLVRRFVEVGVPGYHIEDQKPGCKKCGHQAGKVLVSQDEQIKRLNAARFQLDIMKVPGIIVARTDAESATFLDSRTDERDQPFILGATNSELPSYRVGYLAVFKLLHELGIDEVRGHFLFAISQDEFEEANAWLKWTGIESLIKEEVETFTQDESPPVEPVIDKIIGRYNEAWQTVAGIKTYARAIADVIELRRDEGDGCEMTVDEWLAFARKASYRDAKAKAKSMGVHTHWDCELPKTPDGFYQIEGGIDYAIAKSLASAPFADILWMETKTANLDDARKFAEAIHAEYPEQMLAYNLSPSFNWDTTGMSDEEMHAFPEELGKMGYVFNFITYGGHQVDGAAGEEFAQALQQEGMLALARLQRKFRLVESPYRTPQALVGGARADAGLMAVSGRTATTKAMGKRSTHFQHLVQTELPTEVLDGWLAQWAEFYGIAGPLRTALRPNRAGSELLELQILDEADSKVANVIFAQILDRRGRKIMSVRDQNTYQTELRKKRLMTLAHLFLIHRYKIVAVHYVSPTEDNQYQAQKMKSHGLFTDVHDEVGHIIAADVNIERVKTLLQPGCSELVDLIQKRYP
ncbi:MAG: isocitrate lyase ICL2 [Planctomycetota bacterium]|jgi:isocitrate lyase